MKIATFNVNGVSSRLPRLLEWLAKEKRPFADANQYKAEPASAPSTAVAPREMAAAAEIAPAVQN